MTVVDASAIAMIRELRDRLERRVSESEDGRALKALNHQLDLLERQRWAAPRLALPAPDVPHDDIARATAPREVEGAPEEEFDLDKWVAPPPKRWWRRFG